jgi:hypothetical protein
VELSPAYFRDACFYCEAAERQMATPSLFDLLAEESEACTSDEPSLAKLGV